MTTALWILGGLAVLYMLFGRRRSSNLGAPERGGQGDMDSSERPEHARNHREHGGHKHGCC